MRSKGMSETQDRDQAKEFRDVHDHNLLALQGFRDHEQLPNGIHVNAPFGGLEIRCFKKMGAFQSIELSAGLVIPSNAKTCPSAQWHGSLWN